MINKKINEQDLLVNLKKKMEYRNQMMIEILITNKRVNA